MRAAADQRRRSRYCEFHRDHGHDTNDCIDLKRQIEELIKRGKIGRYVANREDRRADRRNQRRESPRRTIERSCTDREQQNNQPIGEIKMISGGFAAGGESSAARKKYARDIGRTAEVLATDRPSKKSRYDQYLITFTEEEAREVCQPHDDPLVISSVIANFRILRILVDSGSSADILYWGAFEKIKIRREKLQPTSSPLVGFTGSRVVPLGSILLPVTLGVRAHQITKMINFLVVDCPSAYNAILGRTSLNQFRTVTSTYHLRIKFPTETGIGCVKGDQRAARECYMSSLKGDAVRETLVVEELEVRDDEEVRRGEPEGELEEITVGSPDSGRTVKISSSIPEPLKKELKECLRKNADVFAWSHQDMPGIDTKVMAHHLNVFPTARPVKQKR